MRFSGALLHAGGVALRVNVLPATDHADELGLDGSLKCSHALRAVDSQID